MGRRSLALISAALLIVSACGGTTAPVPAAQTAAPTKPPRATVNVSIGSAASLLYLSWDLAAALGYFEDENIDVKLTYQAGGTQAATALLSGSADFAGNSLDHSIKAQLQGKPTKMVVSFARQPGVAIVVRNDLKDKVKTISDLKGQTVGATSIGSGTHLLLTYAMVQNGMQQDKDYKFAAIGSSTMIAALDKGDVGAAMNSDPFVTQYVALGKGFVLPGGDFRAEKDTKALLGGDYQFTGAVTTAEYIQKNPDVVQRVVNALVRANRYLAANPAATIAGKLPESVTGKDKELYVKTLDAAKGYLSADGIVDPKGVENVLKVNVESCKVNPATLCGNVKPTDKVDTAALYDNSFAQKVKK
ncbi:MAG: ABC transporter substrate-binding protein [Candidatus Limnocylindria bacterium]|nr:ABC transporter substrate-binding protein [Chloroflexota bacterium]MDQ3399416.1 ABC transporter substrate-binding protein [Chloroflexota bacterium]